MDTVFARCELVKSDTGLDFALVDFDQLVFGANIGPDENIFALQRTFIMRAKQIAEKLNICFLFLAQLNKNPAKSPTNYFPSLDDIYGDTSTRNIPQVILWLSREYFQNKLNKAYEDKAKVYVLKNRQGRTGAVDIAFDPKRVRLVDPPPTEVNSTTESKWQDRQTAIADSGRSCGENDLFV